MKRGTFTGVVAALGLAGVAVYFLGERETPARDGMQPAARVATPGPPRASPPAPAPMRAVNRTAAPVAPPLPTINAPVAAILDDLKKQADAGSTAAACRLSFELDRCRNGQRVQRNAANYANLANQPGTGPELQRRYTAFADREQARALEIQRLCVGVSKDESAEAWRYLLQAARAGHGPSMARYANRTTLWDEDPIRILDGLIAFRAEGPGFLQAAAQQGYAEAYEQLAFANTTGVSLGLDIQPDRVKGLAYYLALMRTGTPEEVARLQRAIDYSMRRENLSQDDLAKARLLAEPLAATLLKRYAPGSVDFTTGTYGTDNGSHCEK